MQALWKLGLHPCLAGIRREALSGFATMASPLRLPRNLRNDSGTSNDHMWSVEEDVMSGPWPIILTILALHLLSSIKILRDYERGAVMRLGRVLRKPRGRAFRQ